MQIMSQELLEAWSWSHICSTLNLRWSIDRLSLSMTTIQAKDYCYLKRGNVMRARIIIRVYMSDAVLVKASLLANFCFSNWRRQHQQLWNPPSAIYKFNGAPGPVGYQNV